MLLPNRLTEYVNACFTGIWLQTHEPDEAEREIRKLAADRKWNLYRWDIAQGCGPIDGCPDKPGDPLDPLRQLPTFARPDETALLLLHNFHRFLNNPMVVQELFNQLLRGKHNRTFILVLAPSVQLPPELEKVFVVVEHPLPGPEELRKLALETEDGGKTEIDHPESISAASGLTRYEAEAAFALSLARHGHIQPDEVWELKESMLKKSGILQMHRGKEAFADLGGLESLKGFCKKALMGKHIPYERGDITAPDSIKDSNGEVALDLCKRCGKAESELDQPCLSKVKSKGILLLGVPGTGKSAFAKALGNESGRPTLTLDIGALFGSLVGQTEERVRQALKVADAMAPCILFVDEIEKALAGVGGEGDSGVSARLFGTLLTWLNDHTSDVFFIGTCNDVSKLPPEFSRAERFDGIFFIDLPSREEKRAIWHQYVEAYLAPKNSKTDNAGLEKIKAGVDDTNWTGAEIKACCRLAALLGVPLAEATQNVVPVATTAAAKVASLREWASGRCLSASTPGIFHHRQPVKGTATTKRRSITKEPAHG